MACGFGRKSCLRFQGIGFSLDFRVFVAMDTSNHWKLQWLG
jgi:hypothetical protein